MKSHEARIAEAVASLTHRLDSWGVDDAGNKAHEFVQLMLRNGWRTTRAELDPPPPRPRPAETTTRDAALAECRAAIHRTEETV